ncbi:MAG TPA: DUF6519 domain-containing protein [Candidatus Limnocylindrales bacterium]
MNGDISRATFRPRKHFHDVGMQQGRVQLDADWNESQDIGSYLGETTRIDTIGRRGVPKVGGGFVIGITPGGADLTIGAGRLYVDGLLCELDAEEIEVTSLAADQVTVERIVVDDRQLTADEWIEIRDPSGAIEPQVVRIASVDEAARTLAVEPSLDDTEIEGARVRRLASYTTQPDLPAPELASGGAAGSPPTVEFEDGTYLVYLDAWLRSITAVDDPALLEPALGGLDTATRTRTMAQVRIKHVGPDLVTDCATIAPLPDLFAGSTTGGDRPPSTGRLAARATPIADADDICDIPPDARYQGLENQLYRVHVHDPGELGTATFTWSRENASIAVLWIGQIGNTLAVSSLGRDSVLGFATNQLVELIDDTRELQGRPGVLATVSQPPTNDELTIAGPAVDRNDFPGNPRIRRWDNPTSAAITVAQGPGDGYLDLEDGVQIRFEPGHYNTGDHWLIPARTATHDVEWPRDSLERPLSRPPDGIVHHYAPLALVQTEGGAATAVHDCREPFPSLTMIAADDVSFDNEACAIPGAQTVQDAIDVLCEGSTLRHHKKHLHGWGIVCGLRVQCGPDAKEGDRRTISVGSGYAIDCDGNDVNIDETESFDVLDQMTNDGVVIDGRGDLSLFMTNDVVRGREFHVELYDPGWDKRKNPLAGDFWNRVYEECIAPIETFVRDQLGTETQRRGRIGERQAILASLIAQILNPKASQTIYLSGREHEIMRGFYVELRKLLESETFCAMFDGATPFPEYSDLFPGMDTIFASDHHQRIRVRPGKREVWTVGGGINPIHPSSGLNRYDLQEPVVLQRLAPISGTVVADDAEPDSGAGPITDVAFSPDGRRVYVIAPTKNGQNTLFRAGRVRDDGVDWGELVTICDVELLSLATTRADPEQVYAIGARRGLFQIDPTAVDPSMPPVLEFRASGHLVLTDEGRGYATAVGTDEGNPVPEYTRLVSFTIGTPATFGPIVEVPEGSDDLAVAPRAGDGGTVYVVAGPAGIGTRHVIAFDGLTGSQRANIEIGDGPVKLVPYEPTGVLLVVNEDDCNVTAISLEGHKVVANYELPVQVGPVSGAANEESGFAYVLNYWSDTITVLPDRVLEPEYRFPLDELAEYRRQILLAFRDLVAGLIQYLKDCLCDELMVACPACAGGERIYLGSINIRDGQVYKVCNFSRRRYVKSFPTIDYWLSVVPVMPLVQRVVEEFCCMVLPDLFGRYEPPERDPDAAREAPKYRYSTGRSNVDLAQSTDFGALIHDAWTRANVAGRMVADTARRSLGRGPADPGFRVGNVVGRPTDQVDKRLTEQGISVRRAAERTDDPLALIGDLLGLIRSPRSGDEVTLFESGGAVSYYSIGRPSSALTASADADVGALVNAVHDRDEELADLRGQVAELRQAQRAPGDGERVAALEAEVRELRALREDVNRLLGTVAPPPPSKPARKPRRTTKRETP